MSQGIRLYRLCQFIPWSRKEKESYSIDTYAVESVDIIRGVNVDLRQYEYQDVCMWPDIAPIYITKYELAYDLQYSMKVLTMIPT